MYWKGPPRFRTVVRSAYKLCSFQLLLCFRLDIFQLNNESDISIFTQYKRIFIQHLYNMLIAGPLMVILVPFLSEKGVVKSIF